MNKVEIVKSLITAIEKNNFTEAKKLLSDDFMFTGAVPKPMNADQWLGMHKKINQGVPDFCFNISDLNESGNNVNGTVKVNGTQSKELPSLMEGTPALPATNKKFENPQEDVVASFKGDKINKIT